MTAQNVNVSAPSDLAVLVKYLFYFILLLVGIYAVLAGAAHVAGSFVSYRTIDRLMQPITPRVVGIPLGPYEPQIKNLEALKDRFFLEDGFSGAEFSIGLSGSEQINAFITPGKQIFFTKGMLTHIHDEDILFFILAHEIGHYKNKDAFRSGARLLLFYAVNLFLDHGVADTTAHSAMLHYSRAAELAADCFAAQKLQAVYGSTEGGRKFFGYLAQNEPQPQWAQYINTHPGYTQRIANLSKCVAD